MKTPGEPDGRTTRFARCWSNIDHALILTDANADPITPEGKIIETRAVAQWLLEQNG